MAKKQLFLRGASTSIPVGFSVTTLFFGFWPSLFRGHLTHALVVFMVELFLSTVTFAMATASAPAFLVMFVVSVVVRLIFAANRNAALEEFVKSKGWRCPDEDEPTEESGYVQ